MNLEESRDAIENLSQFRFILLWVLTSKFVMKTTLFQLHVHIILQLPELAFILFQLIEDSSIDLLDISSWVQEH
jgi:hypothetical protein